MRRCILALALVLSGCAHWVNDNPDADYNRDEAHCQYEVDLHDNEDDPTSMGDAVASGIFSGIHDAEVKNECLEDRGWYQVRNN